MKKLIYICCIYSLIYWGIIPSVFAQQQMDVKKLYELTDSCEVNLRSSHSPLIGLSANRLSNEGSRISGTYVKAVQMAGGIPVIIPVTTDGAVLRAIVSNLDGIIMTGGEDIDPAWYKESHRKELGEVDSIRDIYDLKLLKLAMDRNIPLLGICRGEQLINVAFGGTLYQDIPSQREQHLKHYQELPGSNPTHKVVVKSGSLLANILEEDTLSVNSFHHQGIKDLAPGFTPVAYSTDGIIEGIEAWPDRPVLAVQWHPESLTSAGDTTMLKLFRFLVEKAEVFYQAKEMHKRFLSVDTHTDTPFWFKRDGFSIADREQNRVNLPKMEEGYLDGVFLAAFIWQGKRDEASLNKAVANVTSLVKGIHQQAELHKDLCGIAYTSEDFARLKKERKKAFFIGIENGYGIGKDLSNIARFKKMGVNYITLCHSYDNDICDSSTHTNNEWNGLSPFGAEVVKEMNRQGVMIDMSHASEKSFYDVLKLTKTPIICSHSSSKALRNHDRNLTDNQLRALAKNGGVAQVCLLDAYLNPNKKKACLSDAIRHIDHMVKVAGIDHVGIGSDFDGGGGIIGCQGDNDFIQITVKLIERGYTEEDIAKIWGGNLLRVLSEVQAAATINQL